VYCADGTLVNEAFVRRGYAQASTYPPGVAHQDLFLRAQREALEAKRGLWGPRPTETAQSSRSRFDCSGNLHNCSDFSTQPEAQMCCDFCQAVGRGDCHWLEDDCDSVACESVPWPRLVYLVALKQDLRNEVSNAALLALEEKVQCSLLRMGTMSGSRLDRRPPRGPSALRAVTFAEGVVSIRRDGCWHH